MSDLLIGARAAQFASSLLIAGIAIFSTFVASPALGARPALLGNLQRRLDRVLLIALGFAIISGIIWFLAFAALIDEAGVGETVQDGTAWALLLDTQFGRLSTVRLLAALLLAALLPSARALPPAVRPIARGCITLIALGLSISLAWGGHAGSGVGLRGLVHLVNDAVHLASASCWAGGLLPFLIAIAPQEGLTPALRVVLVQRFSSLALNSVVVLLASGIVNAWFMLPRLAALIETDYGRLLLVKIALFAVMLGLGGANRYRFIPKLSHDAAGATGARATWQISAVASIELGLAFAVMCVVAVLGQLQPPGN